MASLPMLPSSSMTATDPEKELGHVPWYLIGNWFWMNNVVGSGPKGGYTVNLIDMVDEPFFNLVMQLLGSASDAYDNVVEVQKKNKTKTKKTLFKIYQATNPFFSLKNSVDTQEAFQTEARLGWGYWAINNKNTIQKKAASEQVSK